MPTTPNASEPGEHAPYLRVVRGDATPEEIAALTAVLTVRTAQTAHEGTAADGGPHSGWRDRSRLLRAPLRPGPSAWRAAYHPG